MVYLRQKSYLQMLYIIKTENSYIKFNVFFKLSNRYILKLLIRRNCFKPMRILRYGN